MIHQLVNTLQTFLVNYDLDDDWDDDWKRKKRSVDDDIEEEVDLRKLDHDAITKAKAAFVDCKECHKPNISQPSIKFH